MFSNSILFQDLLLGPLVNAHISGGVTVIAEMQHLVSAIEGLKEFITRIVTPILIISGLATGVRS